MQVKQIPKRQILAFLCINFCFKFECIVFMHDEYAYNRYASVTLLASKLHDCICIHQVCMVICACIKHVCYLCMHQVCMVVYPCIRYQEEFEPKTFFGTKRRFHLNAKAFIKVPKKNLDKC